MEQQVERWRTHVRFVERYNCLRAAGGSNLLVFLEYPDERLVVKRIGAEDFQIDKLWQVFTGAKLTIG